MKNIKSQLQRYIAGYQPYTELKELQEAISGHLRERDRIDAMFADRPALPKQYFKIVAELRAIGVMIGASKNREDIKQWRLDWKGDRTAALYWTSGNGWTIAPIKDGDLSGEWEGFDLIEFLDSNGVDTGEFE